ncbi:MAG: hypothetical protein GC180_12000 [Bacteroidetes bacterium]|nr:hypothetical protein [Bacteroidota bacterium]
MNTKRDKIFYLFFGYFEVSVDVLSGLAMLLATGYFMGSYLPGIHFFGNMQEKSIEFIIRSFGYMVLMSGLMQFVGINYGGIRVRKYLLMALMTGDFMQLFLSGLFFYSFDEWTGLMIFNFVFTFFLFVSRTVYLVIGVPENTRFRL